MHLREISSNLQVPCLNNAIDLQRVCQKENLKLSPETNKYLLYQCLKKLGPILSQKIIKRMVEAGQIEWDDDEDFEVEEIKDYATEDDVEYYLIKWKNWSNKHNTWEPKEHLDCPSLLKEYHEVRGSQKRKRMDKDKDRQSKVSRIDDLFSRISKSQQKISPLQLLDLSRSPTKKTSERFSSLLSSVPVKRPRSLMNINYSNKRSKAYKQMREETQKALKEWEKQLNEINTDPGKITVENLVDVEGPPDNFQYINDYRAGEGITIPQDPFIGCECELCFTTKKQCCGHNSGSEFAYNAYKRLRVPFGTPIYECNKRCTCDMNCPNRVVQHGRKFKLCIFRTANGRGWGVKSLQNIKKGSFVMEYVGEVITTEEAERRGMMYDTEGRTYLFDLDYNDDDCPFTVDAGFYGNISHFVNHSCDPNLHVFGVWINTLDPRLPRIALFAKKDINKGDELTFDYMMTGATGLDLNRSMNHADVGDEASDDTDENPANANGISEVSHTANGEVSTEEPVNKTEDNNNEQKLENESDVEINSDSKAADPPTDQSEIAKNEYPILSANQTADSNHTKTETTPKMQFSPRKSPPMKNDNSMKTPPSMRYRLMCQCGAQNCRKYLF